MSGTTILTGIQPSGELHLGNYFGAVRPAIERQASGDCFYFLADYHALTSVHDPEVLRRWTVQLATDLLALGMDPQRAVIFRQSDVPEVTELQWILQTVVNVGFLQMGHSYKDKVAKGVTPSSALLCYPVLMAADILLYDADLVPVGKDQKQHLEFTRQIARSFNHRYGEVLRIPEPLIDEATEVVPGLDGGKMSKSQGNTIPVFLAGKPLKKCLGRIVTDSKELDQPKDPEACNVVDLYRLFASEDEVAEIGAKYRAGGYGYGHAKAALKDMIDERFSAARERRAELLADPGRVHAVLADGAGRARQRAQIVLKRVRKACGLR
jgi:tryptophanyl-tRNA synthetase